MGLVRWKSARSSTVHKSKMHRIRNPVPDPQRCKTPACPSLLRIHRLFNLSSSTDPASTTSTLLCRVLVLEQHTVTLSISPIIIVPSPIRKVLSEDLLREIRIAHRQRAQPRRPQARHLPRQLARRILPVRAKPDQRPDGDQAHHIPDDHRIIRITLGLILQLPRTVLRLPRQFSSLVFRLSSLFFGAVGGLLGFGLDVLSVFARLGREVGV